MDYDETSVADRYGAARALPPSVMARWRLEIKAAAPLRAGATVADVGCGTGRFSGCLSEAYGGPVIGCDRSATMLAQARAEGTGGELYCLADAQALPFRERSIGMLFLSNVVHHLRDLSAAARSFVPLLEPGGFVVVRNYTRDELSAIPYISYFPGAIQVARSMTPSREDLSRAFEHAGFRQYSARVVSQPVADSPRLYLEKVASRVYSDLVLLPDDEFERGLLQLRKSVQDGTLASLTERIDLLAFQCA